MKPQTRAVLELLRTKPEGVTPREALIHVGTFRLGARVFELRQLGYVIRSEHVREGIWRYVLEEKAA